MSEKFSCMTWSIYRGVGADVVSTLRTMQWHILRSRAPANSGGLLHGSDVEASHISAHTDQGRRCLPSAFVYLSARAKLMFGTPAVHKLSLANMHNPVARKCLDCLPLERFSYRKFKRKRWEKAMCPPVMFITQPQASTYITQIIQKCIIACVDATYPGADRE